jgi:subtilase family serine protease
MKPGKALTAVSAAVVTAGTVALAAAPAASAHTTNRTTFAGSAAPRQARSHEVGAVARNSSITFDMVLKLRDANGAQSLLRAISTPGSKEFRHFLTAAQWEARFSPTRASVRQVQRWLRGEGFRLGAVAKDRITVSASGTAGQVESAFRTSLGRYRLAGHVVRLASRNLSVPRSLAASVSGVMGVNETFATPPSQVARVLAGTRSAARSGSGGSFPPPPGAFETAGPCSYYYGQHKTTLKPAFGNGYARTEPWQVCGYRPQQFRSGYGLTSSQTGAGTTVAITDAYASGTQPADATTYFKRNAPALPFSAAHFTEHLARPFTQETLCGASGWQTEEAIDIEAVHSTAPDAHILYVGGASCFDADLLAAIQYVVDNGLANVITNSWADTGGDLLTDLATRTAYDDTFMMAGSTGISVLFSSGDDLDNFALFGFSAANYPSESPYITSVGGTSLAIGANGKQIGDWGWSTGHSYLCTKNLVNLLCTKSQQGTWLPVTFDGGSGGFTSYNYSQPYYQAGIVPTALSERNAAIDGPVPMRVVPDISMEADPSTGFRIGLTEAFPNGTVGYGQTRYGGTSLASPLLAGVLADAAQAAGTSLGFVNPTIYHLDKVAPSAIQDVLPHGPIGEARNDYTAMLFGVGSGLTTQFREITWEGDEVYCDTTGNCASRPNPLSTAKGYDSMTGLGSITPSFVGHLAAAG